MHIKFIGSTTMSSRLYWGNTIGTEWEKMLSINSDAGMERGGNFTFILKTKLPWGFDSRSRKNIRTNSGINPEEYPNLAGHRRGDGSHYRTTFQTIHLLRLFPLYTFRGLLRCWLWQKLFSCMDFPVLIKGRAFTEAFATIMTPIGFLSCVGSMMCT